MHEEVYMCIDLKSFFASVECVELGLDPMTTKLVVADPERGDKTICLAVTPAMKAAGVRNRCRVFEIPKSIEYITAEPRMQLYIDYSAKIYGIYLDFICPDDIHVYSIDEVFIYATPYLRLYGMSARELAAAIMEKIFQKTGIRATCGIGSNMYLCKIALDIEAKHAKNFIGELDEDSYKEKMWDHRPLTDFWRVGKKTAQKLAKYGIYTMRDITRTDEELLYGWFGIDAELLIDHAWGREPTRISDIKAYKTKSHSITSGQVLMREYSCCEGRVIVAEMAEALCLDLVRDALVCSSVSICIGYGSSHSGEYESASVRLSFATNADSVIVNAVCSLYDRIADKAGGIRRINISFNNVSAEDGVQYSLFDDTEALEHNRRIQNTMIDIKKKYGRNAILKGINYDACSTARERNMQIGGHKSGRTNSAGNADIR